MKIHLRHPGTPEPSDLTRRELKSWRTIAAYSTLCWRFRWQAVNTTTNQKLVTCASCLKLLKGTK